jgi:ketosteroid isomerase-like protein
MFSKSQRISLSRSATIFAIAILVAACSGAEPDPADIVRQYYSAIEDGDADAAASLFSEAAVIVTPSGNTVRGESIKSEFIPFDLQFMDRVEFQTDFTESNGKVSWTQEWHHIEGGSFMNECEVTIEDGKIVEWLFN